MWPQGRPDLAFDGGGKVLRPGNRLAVNPQEETYAGLASGTPDERRVLLLDRHEVEDTNRLVSSIPATVL